MSADDVDVWMPFYLNTYDAKTSRLTDAEDRCYMRLIKDYWRNGPPPDDDERLALIVQKPLREWKQIRKAIEPFFVVEGGLWLQTKVEKELTKARGFKARASAGGIAKAAKAKAEAAAKPRAKRGAKPSAKTLLNGVLNGCETSAHHLHPPIGELIESSPDRGEPTRSPHDRGASVSLGERKEVGELFAGWREELRGARQRSGAINPTAAKPARIATAMAKPMMIASATSPGEATGSG